jgi:phosphoribosylanthranilate isomerase
MQTRIKICGITNLEDLHAAVEFGADALGFIFHPASPRYVGASPELPALLDECPPFVTRVAVCRSVSEVGGPLFGGFDAVQYYEGAPGEWGKPPRKAIRAFRIKDASSLEEIEPYAETASALLLDTYHSEKLGGSGETFNWELAVEAKRRFNRPVILAGGLTPENVGAAVTAVRPFAVDVSSGVEASPGVKDHGRLKAFIEAVREADLKLV